MKAKFKRGDLVRWVDRQRKLYSTISDIGVFLESRFDAAWGEQHLICWFCGHDGQMLSDYEWEPEQDVILLDEGLKG